MSCDEIENHMKKIILLSTLLILGTNTNSQSLNFNQSEFEDENYFIELPYQKIKGKIIIDVQIRGQVLKFILDTGAPTAIRKELSESLGLEILSNEDMTDINGNKGAFKVAKIDKLILGNSAVVNIPSVVIKEYLMKECLKVDGLIGSNLFHSSVVQFDDQNSIVRISNATQKLELANVEGADIFIDKQSSPILTIQLGENATEMLLFDTGDDCLYAMASKSMRKFKKTKSFSTLSKSIGSTSLGINGLEQATKKYRLLIPEFKIPGLTLKNIISETTNGQHSRVGCRLLELGVFTIDFKNSKSYFQPYSKETAIKKTFWDLSPTFINEKLVVGRIWTSKLKNISVGDRIISINDIDVENISMCDFLINSPFMNIEKATLKIKNSVGEVSTIQVQKNN